MSAEKHYLATLQRARDNHILFFSEEELTPYLIKCIIYGLSNRIIKLTYFENQLLPGWDVEWL